MSDTHDFEPRLGRPGTDRRARPPSQLKALAKSARWGKVRTLDRPKLAWGTVRHKGRGKGAAAMARHHAHPGRRRLFLKTSIAVAGPSGTKAFAAHIAYIARDGTTEHGGPGRIFDRGEDDADTKAFNARAAGDVRQFRWMVSPDDAGDMQDLTRFTRTLMRQVERDLRCEVDWVAASHFNTAHPHVHIAVRGGDPQTDELIIARRYLTHGLRHRIEETLTAELGYRRGLERAEDLARAVSEDRFTGLDADLERAAPSGEIDLSGPAGRSSGAPWSARVGRLCHLRGRGLAEHAGGPLWRLQPGWADALKAMGQRAEAERDMARLLGERVGAGHLHTLPPGAGVTGRLAGFIAERTATGRHFIVIEGLDGRAWSAPVTARTARGLPAPGSVVTLTAVPAPLSREAGAAGAPSQGAGVRIDAWIEIGQQVRRAAYTWLDTLDEAALDGAAGFGADVRAARLARQLWLRAQGLYPAQRAVLTSMELEAVAASQAARLGKTYDAGTGHGAFQGKFAGHVDTAQGRLAIVESRTRFALAAWPQDSAPVAGQEASIVRGRVTFGRVLGRSVT